MTRKMTSAEFRAFQPRKQAHDRQEQATNSAGGQSRAGSVVEALANVVAGYLIALLAQQAVLPLFAVDLSLAAHAWLAAIFTLLSLMRSYLLRRLFEHVEHIRHRDEAARQERLRRSFSRGRV